MQNILVKYGVDRRELIAIRLMRRTLTAEFLGDTLAKEFERQASELERLADVLKNRTADLRATVAAAVQRMGRKGK